MIFVLRVRPPHLGPALDTLHEVRNWRLESFLRLVCWLKVFKVSNTVSQC